MQTITANSPESLAWNEYDAAAEWCAQHGIKGRVGDALPPLLSGRALGLINDDPEAFEERVKGFAYALAMARHETAA